MPALREPRRSIGIAAPLLATLMIWSSPGTATQAPMLQTQADHGAAPRAAAVYRCTSTAGAVQFSNAPCPSGMRGSTWHRPAPPPGIAAAGGAAQRAAAPHALLAAPAAPALAGPTEPWVDCRQRGGSFDVASRVCKLPADAVEHMFLVD